MYIYIYLYKNIYGFFFTCLKVILCVPVICLHIILYTACMPRAHGGQKAALAPLELESKTVMNQLVSSENGPQVLWKHSQRF